MRRIISAAAMLAAGVVGVHAADLIVDEPEVVAAPAAQPSIYVQLLGGLAAGLDVTYDGQDPFSSSSGYALAGTVGVVVVDGLSIEGDVFYTHRDFDVEPNSTVSTLSLMGNLKYTVPVSDGFGLYAGAGLGHIWLKDVENGVDYDLSGFGYQVMVGATAQVAENVSLVGELRYQDTFGKFENEDDALIPMHVPNAAAMIGIKLGF